MSWNEVKVGLVPAGSKVYASRDRSTTGSDSYPVTVLTVRPPDPATSKPIEVSNLEAWLVGRGFSAVSKKPQSSRYELDDISALVVNEGGSLSEINLNLRVCLNVRIRIKVWEQLVKELCESFHLQLIDPDVGLVEPTAFEELVKGSFAWKCFLEREKSGTH